VTKPILVTSEDDTHQSSIVVSIATASRSAEGPWAAGIFIRPGTGSPLLYARGIRKATDSVFAQYNAIYEALSLLKESPNKFKSGHPLTSILIRTADKEPPTLDKHVERWNTLSEVMKEMEEEIGISIGVTWHPRSKDIVHARKLAQQCLGIVVS